MSSSPFTKVSEITSSDVERYLRIDETDQVIVNIMDAAKGFILSYTNRTQEEIDSYPDMWLPFMILCQDMYDNRALAVEKKDVNQTVKAVLDMHCRNLIL